MDGPKLLFIINEFLDDDTRNAYLSVADTQITLLTLRWRRILLTCMNNAMSCAILKLSVSLVGTGIPPCTN